MQRWTMPESDLSQSEQASSREALARAAAIAAMSQRLAAAGPRTRQLLHGRASVPPVYLAKAAPPLPEVTASDAEVGELEADDVDDAVETDEAESESEYLLPDSVREALADFGWRDAARLARRAVLLGGAAASGFAVVLAGMTVHLPSASMAKTMLAGLLDGGVRAPAVASAGVAASAPAAKPVLAAAPVAAPKLVLASAALPAGDGAAAAPPAPVPAPAPASASGPAIVTATSALPAPVFAKPVPLPPVQSFPLGPEPSLPAATVEAAGAGSAPAALAAAPPGNVAPAPPMVPEPTIVALAGARLAPASTMAERMRAVHVPAELEVAVEEHRPALKLLVADAGSHVGGGLREAIAAGRHHPAPPHVQPAFYRVADARNVATHRFARFALPSWVLARATVPASRPAVLSPPPHDLSVPAPAPVPAPVSAQVAKPDAEAQPTPAPEAANRETTHLPPIPPARDPDEVTASSDDARPAPPAYRPAPPSYAYGYGYPNYGYQGGGYSGYYGGYAPPAPYYPGYYGGGQSYQPY